MPPSDDEARVARLLREARHEEAVPEDVAARLDDVLSDLARERSEAAPPTPGPAATPPDPHRRTDVLPFDPLAARRRRRRSSALLVAAAAVVAAVGIGVAVPSLQSSDEDAATSSEAGGSAEGDFSTDEGRPGASSSVDGQSGPGLESAPQEGNDLGTSRDAAALAPRAGEVLDGGPRELRTTTLEDDVSAVLAEVATDPVPVAGSACAATPGAGGVGILTTYDDVPALLVVDPSTGAARVLGCADGDLLATVGAD